MKSERTRSGKLRKELHGPRLSPLKICGRESRKIGRPATTVPSVPIINGSQPVIIYMESPKIIHAEVHAFKNLVQRLTGRSSSSETNSCSVESENLASDQSTIICQVSENLNMGSSRTNHRSSDVNPTSRSMTKSDRNQEIESWVSEGEATDLPQSGVTSATYSSTALLPF